MSYILSSITDVLPVVRLITLLVMTVGVVIAVKTYSHNRADKNKDKQENTSQFYLERCELALDELWLQFKAEKLNEVSVYSIVGILKSYKEIRKNVNVDVHLHVLSLKEQQYKNLISNKVVNGSLVYFVGFKSSNKEIKDFDSVYSEIKNMVDCSALNIDELESQLILASNYFYGHLMYLNGTSCEFFESVASFLTDIPMEDIAENFKNKERPLKSIRRRYPVLMGAYRYLLNVELKKEGTHIQLPVSTIFKSLRSA